MEKYKLKKYKMGIASFFTVILGFLTCPTKSVSFDNLLNAVKTLATLGMLVLAYFLWNKKKR